MKKIIYIFVILLLTLFACLIKVEAANNIFIESVDPPTQITIYTRKQTPIIAKSYPQDYTPDYRAYLNSSYSEIYPNHEFLGSSTIYYNCHSYAWYYHGNNLPVSGDESCSIADPTTYIVDNSYYEIPLNYVSHGDIITYNSNDTIVHSGIVVSINDEIYLSSINNVYVNSKMGDGPLVGHYATDTNYYTPTTEIKFYSEHSVFIYTSISGFKHEGVCSDCGETIVKKHSLYQSCRFYQCYTCNYKEIFRPVIIQGITYYLCALDSSMTPMTILEMHTYLIKTNNQMYINQFNNLVNQNDIYTE